MQSRILWLLLAAIILIGAVLGLRDCRRDSTPGGDSARDIAAPAAATTPDPAAAEQAAKLRVLERRRIDAMTAAVSTLHEYLAALSGNDRAAADAFWTGKHPPADSGEADLRTLKGLLSLRIQNRTPKPLDSEDVPAALEIPVELRASIEGQALRRYRGWYRLRRAVDGHWEVTSASIDPVRNPE